MCGMKLSLPIDAGANELLSTNPLALLIGMVLDQQIPLEKAFSSPYVLAQRLGHAPTAVELAEFDPEELIAIFAKPPALHRFPKAMAGRVQEVCRALVDRYDGDAANLWNGVDDGRELLKRVASCRHRRRSVSGEGACLQERDEGRRQGVSWEAEEAGRGHAGRPSSNGASMGSRSENPS
jgi:hypothetical protein